MKFLIVEDERQLNDVLYDYILDRYPKADITQVYDGLDAVLHVRQNEYDLILLDVMLPRVNGFDITKALREKFNTPVLMLSALSDEENQLKGYDLGIDEFVAKPYSPKLVVKKIEAILARLHSERTDDMTYGMITYNLQNHHVSVQDQTIQLNKKEWDLFALFMNHPGRLFTREDLLNKVWGYDYFGDARTVDTHIKRLRKKLLDASIYVKTVYKEGYKFEL
jgi:two-component system response regulator VanR